MRLTRLGRATAIGVLVSGAFALGQLVERRTERAATRVISIPGSRVQVADLTGTAELDVRSGVDGVAVTWEGGDGSLTITPDWGTHAIEWELGGSEERTEVGQFEIVTIVLDEGVAPLIVRPAPGPF